MRNIYLCCRRCNEERNQVEESERESMRSFERLSVSMTDYTELIIWCNRHECTVAKIGVEPLLRIVPLPGHSWQVSQLPAIEIVEGEDR